MFKLIWVKYLSDKVFILPDVWDKWNQWRNIYFIYLLTYWNWLEMIFFQRETVCYHVTEFCLKGGANSLTG